jgi:hypothetical protein
MWKGGTMSNNYFSKFSALKRMSTDLLVIIISYIYMLTSVILMNTVDVSSLLSKNILSYMFATSVFFVVLSILYTLKRK